jgi:hypothetical protein
MLLGLRTAVYRTPDMTGGKHLYTGVPDPFGNVFGLIENPHFNAEAKQP